MSDAYPVPTPWVWRCTPGSDHAMLVAANGAPVIQTQHDVDPETPVAKLLAGAPDHALLLAEFASGRVRREPFNLNARHPETNPARGELCFAGLRYTTETDDFGFPLLTDALRSALRWMR